MNTYETDYNSCIEIINQPIILAAAYSAIIKKGKELIYDPITSKFIVYEYDLIRAPYQYSTEYFYSKAFDLFFQKEIITQNDHYDLNDAIIEYNSINIPDYINIGNRASNVYNKPVQA